MADDEPKSQSWWQTVPGLLTSLAAVITAIGGLLAVLHQWGPAGPGGPGPQPSAAAPVTAETPAPRATPAPPAASISASLTANPSSYRGPCPTAIRFAGSITSDRAGPVRYRFIRSDHFPGTEYTLNFEGPGTKAVRDAWSVGEPAAPVYSGWERIHVLAPGRIESAPASFTVTCSTASSEQPKITAYLRPNPPAWQGRCPATVNFSGAISSDRGGVVRYRFVRSDRSAGPELALNFDGPGEKPVRDSWTLNDPGPPRHLAWEVIEILYPAGSGSSIRKAAFTVECR